MKTLPIGVLDSGIGGFTVVKEIMRELPHESILYVGDTARIPYGTRTKETITRFSLELVGFLLTQRVKCIVVACNTVSATCLMEIRKISPVPVVDVIEPTISEAVKKPGQKAIGVIGTRATIASKAYTAALRTHGSSLQIVEKSCPLFVPLAEEGLGNDQLAYLAAKKYLHPFSLTPVDTLILGCTHYPLLYKAIEAALPSGTTIINSAKPTAHALKKLLSQDRLLSPPKKNNHRFFVTDAPLKAKGAISDFFGSPLPASINHIDIEHLITFHPHMVE